MVRIKVKLRKSTVKGKEGTIYYQVYYAKTTVQITSSIHVRADKWDPEKECVRSTPRTRNIARADNQKITEDKEKIQNIITELEIEPHEYKALEIGRRFRSKESSVMILEYMQNQIDHLQKKKRYGTAVNYNCALHSLSAFLHGHDVTFKMLNEAMILKYNDWLEERNLMKNSISFYMRIWRAVYNRAVMENIVRQTHPFKFVYTGVDHTRKRAVAEEVIMKLLKLDLKRNTTLSLARDIFIFSYCTRGMAFIDIAFLKKTNIKDNIIIYYRRKTKQMMTIYIEPCIRTIIDKYHNATTDSEYIFPILTETNDKAAYRQYHGALTYYNRRLKRLAELIDIRENLSSYTSRHTWATTAHNHNIPLSVISAGMGHTSERTTEIYLASLENSVIDDANKNMLKEINSYISF